MSYVYIRNPESGFCLEDTADYVRIKYFSGSDAQKWTLQSTGLGTFYIRNKKNSEALSLTDMTERSPIITSKFNADDITQQWYINKNKTIATASDRDFVLDITLGQIQDDTIVIAYRYTGNNNQHFVIQQS